MAAGAFAPGAVLVAEVFGAKRYVVEHQWLRIGVGPAEGHERSGTLSDYVLSPIGKADTGTVLELLPELTAGIELWIKEGMKQVMNRYSGKPVMGDDNGE